jgi:hypothetical protein
MVGIALGRLGHKVVLSDREPVLLDTMRANIQDNGVHDNCKARNLPNSSGACLLAAMSQHCSAHRVICFRENLCGLRSILSLNFSCKTGSEARLELGLKRSY